MRSTEANVADLRVVTMVQDGRAFVVIAKVQEDDPDVWGVVESCRSVNHAKAEVRRMRKTQAAAARGR